MAEGRAELHGEGGEAGDALRRVQDFDPKSLVRQAELGSKLALREAVAPAQRVIDLFRLITPSQLNYFPEKQKNVVRDQANAFYSLLEKCQSFEIEDAQPSPTEARNELISQLESQFQPVFDALYPLISFANARSLDFSALERDARAAAQSARDVSSNVVAELEGQRKAAATILEEVRAAAAEQGVSKQAIHFKNEADSHSSAANDWRRYTIYTAVGLAIYAVASLFFQYIPGLEPTNGYRATQLAVSKVLIFAVIAYMLFLCARNFLSHKHNEIVNRHRQNALATFTALAEATSDAASSDIVLSHAAACIFSPQETGYTKHDAAHGDGVPNLQIIPRIGHIGSAAA
jgi:hypothetical protein